MRKQHIGQMSWIGQDGADEDLPGEFHNAFQG